MKVLTIGGATQDIIVQYKHGKTIQLPDERSAEYLLLRHGAKLDIDDLMYATGGGATNAAVSFARLGYTTATHCSIGTDCQGELVRTALEHEGVDTQYIITCEQYCTGLSIIIPSADGDRTVLVFRGANKYMQQTTVPLNQFTTYDVTYITSLAGESAQLLKPIAQRAQQDNCLVANNPGSAQLRAGTHSLYESLAHIDILIMNSDEARQFMLALLEYGNTPVQRATRKKANIPRLINELITIKDLCCSLEMFFETIHQHGPGMVVVTDGKEGVYASDGSQLLFHPSIPSTVVGSTIGAGDAFGSAFVATLARTKNCADALRAGVLNASSVIGYLDTKTGLLTHNTLNQRLQALNQQLLVRL